MTQQAAYQKRVTEQKHTLPRCEICGDPSYEWTQDWIYELDRKGRIKKGTKRGDRHYRCQRHARRSRDLIITHDGVVDRYEPGPNEEAFRIEMDLRLPVDVLHAKRQPHTEEDEAFDREWWPERTDGEGNKCTG